MSQDNNLYYNRDRVAFEPVCNPVPSRLGCSRCCAHVLQMSRVECYQRKSLLRASAFGLFVGAVQIVQNRRSFLQNDLAVQVVGSRVVVILRDEFQLCLALCLWSGKHIVRTDGVGVDGGRSVRVRVCTVEKPLSASVWRVRQQRTSF